MRVNSKPYGAIEVDERQKINFPFGLLGFEHLKWYVLLDAAQEPFYWLQSLDDVDVAFVLIDPAFFRPDYRLDVPDDEIREIGIQERGENILTFAIVTIPQKQELMTANLQGPLLIDRTLHVGRQSISLNPNWKVRHYILDELTQVKDEAC
ncbi:MAG TPA: flagellar assembly protein FliW [Spirochaetia bacterium]|nr:flagellar assembly protein FliW [Spirochaetia bacterium]